MPGSSPQQKITVKSRHHTKSNCLKAVKYSEQTLALCKYLQGKRGAIPRKFPFSWLLARGQVVLACHTQDKCWWEDYSFSAQENKKTKIMYTMDAKESGETLEGKGPFGDQFLNLSTHIFCWPLKHACVAQNQSRLAKEKKNKELELTLQCQ